jgi:hypothetical protein
MSLVEEVRKLKSMREQKVLLTAQLAQLERDTGDQLTTIKSQLLDLLPKDTALDFWFRYKFGLSNLLAHGSCTLRILFEPDGKAAHEVSGKFLHRNEAVADFELLKLVWSEVVALSEIELGGNQYTSYMEVELTLL